MSLGYAKSDWQRWVNHSVPLISEQEAGQMSVDEIRQCILDITQSYKPDKESFDEMGWRTNQTVKYHHRKYEIGRLAPVTHEVLKRWRKIEDDTDFFDIARFNAEAITGPSKMNMLALSAGPSGSGKSLGTSNILWGSAIWLSDILTRDPFKWRKFLPYWHNIKCIDRENFTDMFTDLGYQTIRFGDDAFNTLNRKDFATAFMAELNTIAATDRVFRDITYFSAQWAGMLDIIIRQLAQVRIDWRYDEHARTRNLNVCRFHHLHFNQYDKRNPIYNVFHRTGHADVEDYYVGLPCEEILEWYDLYRLLGAVLLKKRPADSDIDEELDTSPYTCQACQGRDIYSGSKDNGVIRCKSCGHKWTVDVHPDGSYDVCHIGGLPKVVHKRRKRTEREIVHAREDIAHDLGGE
jgi:DNA-directed RNA polymerase subunit RPC12/RpoP